MELPFAEPYKIKVTEAIGKSSLVERRKWLRDAKYNLFNLRSDQVYLDFVTDSGTGAMSDQQWKHLMEGDESYVGSRSYYKMTKAIKDILGFEYVVPTHQGRGAENILHSCLTNKGNVVPGNAHYITTQVHIEFQKATTIDCTVEEAFNTEVHHDFKGNIDLNKLQEVLETHPKENIPMIIITVTCNSVGGQPVSMDNIRSVSELARKKGIPICIDGARFAENAYFIKQREPGYQNKTIQSIVHEMFFYADIVTMGAKKDIMANIGGFVAFKDKRLYREISKYCIIYEGYLTYGGMAGRDMEAISQGLKEAVQLENLESWIKQVEFLAGRLTELGIPFQKPVGGHAVFIDVGKIFKHIPKEEFRAETFSCELYIEAGIRGFAMGPLFYDRDPNTGENLYPGTELLRLSVPRKTYTNSHMEYVAVALYNVMKRCQRINRGLRILHEQPIFRLFTAELMKIGEEEEDKREEVDYNCASKPI